MDNVGAPEMKLVEGNYFTEYKLEREGALSF
jgi:hypothetical protein